MFPSFHFSCRLLLGVCLIAAGTLAQAQTPASQLISGTIRASLGTPSVTPEKGDLVTAVTATGTTTRVAQGTVVDGEGTYFVQIDRSTAFNGTDLGLRLTKPADGATYLLVDENAKAATFKFFGRFPFPNQSSLDARIGKKSSLPTKPTDPDTPEPTPPPALGVNCQRAGLDVNKDGTCDDADIEAIQAYINSHSPGASAAGAPEDVNGDDRVDPRDVIESLRALQRARIDAMRKAAVPDKPAVTIERPTAPGDDIRKEILKQREEMLKQMQRP